MGPTRCGQQRTRVKMRQLLYRPLVVPRLATEHAVRPPANLRALVPDIADRDVFVCGPPDMTAAVLGSLRALKVSRPRCTPRSSASRSHTRSADAQGRCALVGVPVGTRCVVDEWWARMPPPAAGNTIKTFNSVSQFHLADVRRYDSGVIILHYQPI